MITLRPYQTAMIDAIMAAVPKDQFVLCQAATGAGKTIIFCELIRRIIERWPYVRIAVLAHRTILIEQTADKLMCVWPDAPIGIACASAGGTETGRSVTIGSIQTLSRLDADPFDIVIIDEAHRLPSRSVNSQYKTWIEGQQAANQYIRILGLTATPYRMGQGLIYGKEDDSHWFPRLSYKIGIPDLQKDGYLCRWRAKVAIDISEDLAFVKKNGEYHLGQLSDLMAIPVHISSAVSVINKHAADRKRIIVFGVTIEHAEKLEAAFRASGIASSCIHSKQPQAQRVMILDQFRRGFIRVLCSVGVLTEGFDEPATDCILLARPTLSTALHVQMCGRGLRPHPDKDDVLILDMANNFSTHGSIDDPILVEGPTEKTRKDESRIRECPKCESILPANAMECRDCGAKLSALKIRDNSRPVEMRDATFEKPAPVTAEVQTVAYNDYTSRKGNRMVQIVITAIPTGQYEPVYVNTFWQFDPDAHPYAINRSRMDWHNLIGTRPPESTTEAMERQDEFYDKQPEHIEIEKDGKYWRITDWNPVPF